MSQRLVAEFGVDHVGGAEDLRAQVRRRGYAVAIMANGACPDGKAGFVRDLDAAEVIHEVHSGCALIFLVTKDLDLAACCRAVKLGAVGFVDTDRAGWLDEVVEQARGICQRRNHQRDAVRLVRESDLSAHTGIVTQSERMLRLLARSRQAARICDAPVIIEGESGTGKQLLAEAVHKMDPKRGKGPFISVNCAAITGTLAESELFGHKRGAFTGATDDRLGYFRAAQGGTLMLDEISELSGALQPKLLRVLQEDKVLAVGDDREHAVDVRVIAASNTSLSEAVAAGRFRLDLYQRLNVIRLSVPPLRERIEDLPILVSRFLGRYGHYYPRRVEAVDPGVYAVLQHGLGEGNVRELENVVRQALAFKETGTTLTISDLPEYVREHAVRDQSTGQLPSDLADHVKRVLARGPADLDVLTREYECRILRTAMSDLGLRGARLARYLKLNRRTLYHKLNRYELI